MLQKLLLVNFGNLGDKSGGERLGDRRGTDRADIHSLAFGCAAKLRFIFREAKINDAVLFFDECEG